MYVHALTTLPTQSMISTQPPSALGYCTRRIETTGEPSDLSYTTIATTVPTLSMT